MGPCYVGFYEKKPRIYMSWHEASEHVLGFKNVIHKKYNNYDHALRDFNAYVGAATMQHPRCYTLNNLLKHVMSIMFMC